MFTRMPTFEECMFCGSTDELTREHIFADWYSKYRGEKIGDAQQYELLVTNTDRKTGVRSIQEIPKFQGNIRQSKLKAVCKSCNTGWMSDLQELAKPILAPLTSGIIRPLGPTEQDVLAVWATMTAMVVSGAAYWFSPAPKEDRHILSHTLHIPQRWEVLIGRCSGFHDTEWSTRHDEMHAISGSNIIGKFPMLSVTIFVDRVFFQVNTSRFPLYPANWIDNLGMLRLYPLVYTYIDLTEAAIIFQNSVEKRRAIEYFPYFVGKQAPLHSTPRRSRILERHPIPKRWGPKPRAT